MLQNNLRLLRLTKGLTQEQLAEKASCTRQTINSIEKNRYNPSLELALNIARILDCDINELFQLAENN